MRPTAEVLDFFVWVLTGYILKADNLTVWKA
jgi:hypothetical protein